MAVAQQLRRADLERALGELGRRAFGEGKTIEIAIYGGSALMLLFDWRLATRDVDAVFEADRATVRRLAREVGIADAAAAIELVTAFYPGQRLAPKVQFGLEEIFADPGVGAS